MAQHFRNIRNGFPTCFLFVAKVWLFLLGAVSADVARAEGSLAQAKEAAQPESSVQLAISGNNPAISFSVDSTWHLVRGTVHSVAGQLTLSRSGEVSGQISVPVIGFDTDNGTRDEKLRLIMAEREYPQVTFHPKRLSSDCIIPKASARCSGKLSGEIQIRDTTRPIEFIVEIETEGEDVVVHAHSVLQWREFGVEDPSFFLAKLSEDVAVDVKYKLGRSTLPWEQQ